VSAVDLAARIRVRYPIFLFSGSGHSFPVVESVEITLNSGKRISSFRFVLLRSRNRVKFVVRFWLLLAGRSWYKIINPILSPYIRFVGLAIYSS
jgi:hypothetical protein